MTCGASYNPTDEEFPFDCDHGSFDYDTPEDGWTLRIPPRIEADMRRLGLSTTPRNTEWPEEWRLRLD